MKKIMTMALAAMIGLGANAIPAKRSAVTVTQSDGTQITVTMVGDEWHHSFVTADGLTVQRAEGTNDFYYRTRDGITTQRAHAAADRTASELSFLAVQRDRLTMEAIATPTQQSKKARMNERRRASQTPSLGSNRVPVILVQYKDIKFKNNHTLSTFQQQYQTGNQSVRQYFIDQSNEQYVPEYDIYGPYTLTNNRATYGGNDSQGNDKGVALMVGEAIDKAGAEIDWTKYDNDGNGEADVCIVVYAGVGEAQASYTVPSSVWPCQWSLSEGVKYSDGTGTRKRNGITIDKFAVFCELNGDRDTSTKLDGVGTFCHEFSHCLGLPDFYKTTEGTSRYGMDAWDLMDYGCYNNDGDTPIGYNGYEKNFMGWLDYIEPVQNTKYTLPVLNSGNDMAVKIQSPLHKDEYYVLENRAKQGWDQYIEDEGMMVTHVTYVASRWEDNTVNNNAVQLFTIIPADGQCSSSNNNNDLYGETNHELTDTSSPAAGLNMKANGSLASSTGAAGKMGQPLTEINLENDGTVTFWYMKSDEPTPSLTVTPKSLNFGTVELGSEPTYMTLTVIGTTLTGDITLTATDGEELSLSATTVTAEQAADGAEVEVGFTPLALGEYTGTITLSSEGVDDVTVAVKATVQMHHDQPEIVPTTEESEITANSFVAHWTAVDNVESYTLRVRHDEEVEDPVVTDEDFILVEEFDPEVFDKEATTDIGLQLDEYMANPGWVGNTIYKMPGAIRIGKSKGTGYLTSPVLDVTKEGYTVLVSLTTYANDTEVPFKISGSETEQEFTINGDTAVVAQFDVLPDATDYRVMLSTTTNKKRVVINGIVVLNGKYDITFDDLAGDESLEQAVRRHATATREEIYEGLTGTSFEVTGLTAATTYTYDVRAIFTDGVTGEWSEAATVTTLNDVQPANPFDVNGDGKVDVGDVNAVLEAILSESTDTKFDVNNDGLVDVGDVNAILEAILNTPAETEE